MKNTCKYCIHCEIDDEGTEDKFVWCNKRLCVLGHDINKPKIPECPSWIKKYENN